MVKLTQQDGIHVLTIGLDESNPENRFSPTWMDAVDQALDQVVAAPAPMVMTGTGKFFSNGLDLDWLGQNPDRFGDYITQVQALLSRVLTLPVPTVAAINGHAFAGGAMLAMAFDWRVMREDRGFFCLPEVDIQLPFTPGMSALLQAKLTPRAAIDTMTTGARLGGPEALAAGIVDGVASEAGVLDAAIAKVAHLTGKHAETLGAIKATMYTDAVTALTVVDR